MNSILNKYFAHLAEDFVFVELTPEFMKRMRFDFMRGVPFPAKRKLLEAVDEDQGVDFSLFIMGMVSMIGIDPELQYAGKYIKFLTYMNEDIANVAVTVGAGLVHSGDLEQAAIHFRAAYTIDPENVDALYNYMLVCRDLYRKSGDKEYVADFKSEVYECLITLKQMRPDMAMVSYFLGYAYINMGRYSMAQQEWFRFLKLAKGGDEIEEIRSRLEDLEDPVIIEGGYSDIIEGRWQKGLGILEGYLGTQYEDWWPLLYYLGVGYTRPERFEEAVDILKGAVAKNPSSPEIVAELIIANEGLHDELNTLKYRKKLKILNTPFQPEDV